MEIVGVLSHLSLDFNLSREMKVSGAYIMKMPLLKVRAVGVFQ